MPMRPGKRAAIENANGRLRRWLPRNLGIDALDEQELQDVVFTANLTPRKCLGYKTPSQAMLADLGKKRHNQICLSPLHFTLELSRRCCLQATP